MFYVLTVSCFNLALFWREKGVDIAVPTKSVKNQAAVSAISPCRQCLGILCTSPMNEEMKVFIQDDNNEERLIRNLRITLVI